MQARYLAIATQTVIDQAYANGELGTPAAAAYIGAGDTVTYPNTKAYNMAALWSASTQSGTLSYDRQIAALADRTWYGGLNSPGAYRLFLRGPDSGDLFDADGFAYTFAPEGNWGDPSIIVTYKMTRASGTNDSEIAAALSSTGGTVQYDPSAGYEVYYISYS
jgi:hypothetical protein